MKRYPLQAFRLFISFLPFIFFIAEAQNLSPQARRTPKTTDLFNGLPIVRPPAEFVGDIYFNSQWGPATVILYENGDTIKGFDVRYNIYFDEIDFRTQNGERALVTSKVKSFTLQDSLTRQSTEFVNSQEYTIEGVPLIGLFEVLVNGRVPLFKRHTLIVKDPDYHPALNAGSRDIRIFKHSDYYAAFGKELSLVKGKKKVLASFGDKAQAVEAYIKTNKILVFEQNGLIRVFEFYNSLLDNP